MSRYTWVRFNGEYLKDIGVLDDGSLYNPNGYPEQDVRAAVAAADERRRVKRSEAAKKAGVTRRARQEKRVYKIARRIFVEGQGQGPALNCVICGRGLTDDESIGRGIGSECWQEVLTAIQPREVRP
jgi:hypothetical protein